MPNTYKILGQVNPSANTQSNVYVVPAATEAVVNSIMVANLGSSNVSYSILVMPSKVLSSNQVIISSTTTLSSIAGFTFCFNK